MGNKINIIKVLLLVGLFFSGQKNGFAHNHGSESHHSQALEEKQKNRGVLGLDIVSNSNIIDGLLAEENNGEIELNHLRSLDGGNTFFKNPIRIKGMKVFTPRRGFEPRIVSKGDKIVALWTKPGTSSWGDGPLQGAVSKDGGENWMEIKSPADDYTTNGHGFVGLTLDRDNTLHAIWLDSRDGSQGLRYSQSRDFGKTWKRNKTIQAKTCECCWSALYQLPDGSINALYRGKNPRDMRLSSSTDKGKTWKNKSTVGKFDWDFNGCPHNGGTLAWDKSSKDGTIYSTVWTGKENKEGVHFLKSADFGKTWSDPVFVGDMTSQHPDLASTDKNIVSVWDAKSENGKRAIYYSYSLDKGKNWSKKIKVSNDEESSPSHARVIAVNGKFLVSWTSKNNEEYVFRRKVLNLE